MMIARISARALWPLMFFAFGPAVLAAPRLPVEKAIRIAAGELKSRGLGDEVFITSVTLEPAARSDGGRWLVRWSEAIPLESTKREIGLEVAMDGSVARVVNVAAADGRPAASESRRALTNHRTRSDRPSILNLKH
ncbi:MAG: hypothetical protein M3463_00585 [Verrucomicrobiota bacterium]|nr:hypothetical protein [Verrucomicrobiota bacterium]